MLNFKKACAASVAGLLFMSQVVSVATYSEPPYASVAYAKGASAQTTTANFKRKDEATEDACIAFTQEHSYELELAISPDQLEEIKAAIDEGKLHLSLSRDTPQFDIEVYPHQFMGGDTNEWKTVATANGPAESGNGIGEEDGTIRESQDFIYDINYSLDTKETPKLKVSFKNRLLYEGIDGIDVRSREFVRSSMYDYVGNYKLSVALDNTTLGAADVWLRPYDMFFTQEEIDAELPKLAEEAKANGLFAEVRQFGTSENGRPMNALFVAKSKGDLDAYQELKERMEKDPAAVQAELKAKKLSYKVPVVYSNVHADEINAVDAVMSFAKHLVANKPIDYTSVDSLTDAGKEELAEEMDHDGRVWSTLIEDKVTGVGFIRGGGGVGNGKNYDGTDTDTASSDLSDEDFAKYYTTSTKRFDPAKLLDDMFFILVPSENVDAREDNVRTNYNGFDLNRDNTYQTQAETRAMAELITTWDPLSLHEVHGYYQQFQVEPCSPTHDPNNEYDLFIATALGQGEAFMAAAISNNKTVNSVMMPMRDYLNVEEDGSRFWGAPFDDMSTSYTPQYAMMHGTNAYTVEAPYGDEDSLQALVYGFIGNADFVAKHKDKMFYNQLERFRRGVENIDADEIRPYYVNQKDEAGAEADVFRPRDPKNNNFFPEYYVIPLDPAAQEDRRAAADTVDLLIRNGVRVAELTEDVTLGNTTYAKGTIVVDMHQAKRNMANCVLYPNLVIDDWSQYSLYSEPVTNFSELRGFSMDTIREVGVFSSAVLKDIEEAPKQEAHSEGDGAFAVIKNTSAEAVRASNALRAAGKEVSLISEGDYAGSYLVETSALEASDILKSYAIDVVRMSTAPAHDRIAKDIKVYIPHAYSEFVTDSAGNDVGMKNYENRLNTNANWDSFALEKQLGFSLTDNLDEASIIVGSAYPENADAVAEKIQAGTPYVAYTADAMKFISDYQLVEDLHFTPEDAGYIGFDALATIEFVADDPIVASYKREGDTLMYGFGGAYITEAPKDGKVLIKTSDERPHEAFMTKDYIEEYKGQIQAVDVQSDKTNIVVFANTLTNKAHQQDDYRYLSAAIYSKQLDTSAQTNSGALPGAIMIAIIVVGGSVYAIYRKKRADKQPSEA